jgi:hypothetical protein
MDAVKFVRTVIDEISADIANGDVIKWEAIDQELRWLWTNTRTGKQWSFNIRVFKRLVQQSDKDPRLPLFGHLVANTKTVPEIQREILRLEALKVFW